MTNDKSTWEFVYETNRDVKWICWSVRQMERCDEDFESRIRAVGLVSGEGWRRGTRRSAPGPAGSWPGRWR